MGVKGVAWLPLVTFSQAAVGTQGSGLVVVMSEAAVREAGNAETGVGCPPAFADGGRAAASAPRTEGGACLCSTLAASRPTVGGQGRHPAGETHPLLARRPAPSCPLPSSCRSGRPCRSSARTTKRFHGGDRACHCHAGAKGLKSRSRPPKTPGRS